MNRREILGIMISVIGTIAERLFHMRSTTKSLPEKQVWCIADLRTDKRYRCDNYLDAFDESSMGIVTVEMNDFECCIYGESDFGAFLIGDDSEGQDWKTRRFSVPLYELHGTLNPGTPVHAKC